MSNLFGIDLGTTHTALAFVPDDGEEVPSAWNVPQLVAEGVLESRPLLPSFVYFGLDNETFLGLPWDKSRRYAVGEHARVRSIDAPGRVVSSAKSWLSHTGIDRRSGVLPQGAPGDVERISPVEALFRVLDHLTEAWRADHPGAPPLTDEEVILTVPASFDAAARDLTVEAAYAAGFEHVSLLEEPQAALYAWIEGQGEDWRKHLSVGDVVLAIDVGGGTTDFSAIEVRESDGQLELHRIAVGDHILLGGDNMDLALAHAVISSLPDGGKGLDRWQRAGMAHACRKAKELLLGADPPASAPVAVTGRGAALVGSAIRSELTREVVERVVVDGFFPAVPASARPAARARSALTQIGLPYASDPAVTRHLAAFLGRQASAIGEHSAGGAGSLLRPTAILFNGGVVKSARIRERIVATLNGWLEEVGAPPVRVLPGDDPDLAVARGAAYYARVRQGKGIRIRGGTARAYYVGIESPMPAVPGLEPPLNALCVAPFGMEEGSSAEDVQLELGVVVGEAVRFRFFGSSVRRGDGFGTLLEDVERDDLEELAPIEVVLPAKERAAGEVVPVRLTSQVTAIGTLRIDAVPLQPLTGDERWQVELSVRSS